MTHAGGSNIRSFILTLYDGKFQELGHFAVPVSVAAPFTNRLFNQVLPQELAVREPWYGLQPHYIPEKLPQRTLRPEGPTSLYGDAYYAANEPEPRLAYHPGAEITYFTVRLFDFDRELYRGEYTVDDIFLAGAEFLARKRIEKGHMTMEEGPFYYKVDASPYQVLTAPQELFPPEAFEVEGVFQLPPLAKDRERIKFRKVPPEPLPERDPDGFGATATHGRGTPGRHRIIMRADVFQALRQDLPLDDRVEDGGYLVGLPYRQSGSPAGEDDAEFRWILEVTDILKAQGAWGGPALLLFTGDSWSSMKRRIDTEFPEKELVAWFHTHLFAATDEFGLSGMDVDLHRRFLTKPWQIAVLINIDVHDNREVRCFQRSPEGDLEECTFEVL